mmetsp:Transcript_164082/g.398772  ORF Transcript_164082/g.398772 Transcript_164082/m.398772 type:complete len:415 (+) Transcript_164082:63-1307(+)
MPRKRRRCGRSLCSLCSLCSLRTALSCLVLGIAVAVGLAWSLWPKYNYVHLIPDNEVPTSGPACDPSLGQDLGGDMMEKGYTIVPNVISEESRSKIMDYANQQPFTNYFSGYRMGDFQQIMQLAPELIPKLEELVKVIQDSSNIRVAASNPDGSANMSLNTQIAMEFLTANAADPGKSVAHIWHQDFEAYYISQSTSQYLNMYLVLEKPEPLEAGLTVAAFDRIRARSAELYDLLFNNAATSWEPSGRSMLIRNHKYYDKFYMQQFPLEDIACTPRLVPGDLLILRGDTPHRTQYPIRSYRTTLSIRLSTFQFSVASMLEGGLVKYSRMHHSSNHFRILAMTAWFGTEEFERFSREAAQGKSFEKWASVRQVLAWRYLTLRIEAGYYGRSALAVIRILSGKLAGETETPPISWY